MLLAQRLLRAFRVDLKPLSGQPSSGRLVLAATVSLAGSLGLDAALVQVGEGIFPGTAGFSHFRLSDYGTLTVIGVLIACVAWPVVTRATSEPRWLFLRLAVLVTFALWLPDLWLLVRGDSARAVGVLMVMHLAIAVVTYNSLVRIAPAHGSPPAQPVPVTVGLVAERKWTWAAMLVAIGVEFVLGVASLFFVPFNRRTDLVPPRGAVLYALHGLVGVLVVVGSLALVAGWARMTRQHRIGAAIGLSGVLIGGAGGLLSLVHSTRLAGAGVMLVGALVAATGYLLGVIDTPEAGPPS